jgi:hypothetical protein
MAPRKPTAITPTSAPPPSADPPGHSPRPSSQQLKVTLRKTKQTSDGAVTIGLTAAVGNIYEDGSSTAFGGGGQTGGGAAVTADGGHGNSTSGLVDFYVETPARNCRAHGVAIGESAVLAEPAGSPRKSGGWIRITVVAVENMTHNADGGGITATFQVSQGQDKAPRGNAACA